MKFWQGVCSEGSSDQPEHGVCERLYRNKTEDKVHLAGNMTWHYFSCPAENECKNGHNLCDLESETCIDLPSGYQCVCGPGYRAEPTGECTPVCAQVNFFKYLIISKSSILLLLRMEAF